MQNQKLSMADLKAKAGKSMMDANAVKGGVLADCHTVDSGKDVDNICIII